MGPTGVPALTPRPYSVEDNAVGFYPTIRGFESFWGYVNILELYPRLADRGVTKDTEVQAYREYKPLTDELEYTLLFKIDDIKWRIDALVRLIDVDPESGGLKEKDLRTLYMGPSLGYTMNKEEENIIGAYRDHNLFTEHSDWFAR